MNMKKILAFVAVMAVVACGAAFLMHAYDEAVAADNNATNNTTENMTVEHQEQSSSEGLSAEQKAAAEAAFKKEAEKAFKEAASGPVYDQDHPMPESECDDVEDWEVEYEY